MDYGVPNGNDRKTVIYDGNLSGGNPLLMDPAVKARTRPHLPGGAYGPHFHLQPVPFSALAC
jgi:hypothetical protein